MTHISGSFNPSIVSIASSPYDTNRSNYVRFQRQTVFNIEELATLVTNSVWSPIVWANDYRTGKNFQFCEWLALDFDEPGYTLEQAKNDYQDKIHVIGTTRSHRQAKGKKPACDRFRVVVRCDQIISSKKDYEGFMKQYVRRVGSDRAASDAGRYMFPCKEIVSVQGTGKYCGFIPPKPNIPRKRRRTPGASGLPGWMYDFIHDGVLPNPTSRNCSLYRAGAFLVRERGWTADEAVRCLLTIPVAWDDQLRREVSCQMRKSLEKLVTS